jgi:UDP-N-acetylglucosamine acyltransferase
MTRIHPTALVAPEAELDAGVEVGPYCVIGAHVRIGAGTVLGPHVVIDGHTTLGRDNRVHPFASIGGAPQDKKYRDEPTRVEIGDANTFREGVTINRGTIQDNGLTRIGNGNWVMAYVHIAHDCVVGDNTIFANSTNLGGHVRIGDWVILGGASGVHQFCQIGAHAMTAVGTVVLHDVPPFVMVSGNSAQAHGINTEGLRRRGFSPARIDAIRRAYRLLYREGLSLAQAREALASGARLSELDPDGEAGADLALLAGFLEGVTRGIVR